MARPESIGRFVAVTDGDAIGQALRAALLAEYNLDGNATDSSGNGRNLTVTGSPTYPSGKVGSGCFNTNGTPYARSAAAIISSGSFWVHCWVNWSDASLQRGIVAQCDSGAAASGTFAIDNAGNTNKRPRMLVASTGSAFTTATWGSDINDSSWHSVAGWFDGTNVKIAIDNGTPVSTAMVGTVRYDATVFSLACAFGAGSNIWNGSIDAVHVFNIAPSAAQLTYMHNSGNGRQLR